MECRQSGLDGGKTRISVASASRGSNGKFEQYFVDLSRDIDPLLKENEDQMEGVISRLTTPAVTPVTTPASTATTSINDAMDITPKPLGALLSDLRKEALLASPPPSPGRPRMRDMEELAELRTQPGVVVRHDTNMLVTPIATSLMNPEKTEEIARDFGAEIEFIKTCEISYKTVRMLPIDCDLVTDRETYGVVRRKLDKLKRSGKTSSPAPDRNPITLDREREDIALTSSSPTSAKYCRQDYRDKSPPPFNRRDYATNSSSSTYSDSPSRNYHEAQQQGRNSVSKIAKQLFSYMATRMHTEWLPLSWRTEAEIIKILDISYEQRQMLLQTEYLHFLIKSDGTFIAGSKILDDRLIALSAGGAVRCISVTSDGPMAIFLAILKAPVILALSSPVRGDYSSKLPVFLAHLPKSTAESNSLKSKILNVTEVVILDRKLVLECLTRAVLVNLAKSVDEYDKEGKLLPGELKGGDLMPRFLMGDEIICVISATTLRELEEMKQHDIIDFPTTPSILAALEKKNKGFKFWSRMQICIALFAVLKARKLVICENASAEANIHSALQRKGYDATSARFHFPRFNPRNGKLMPASANLIWISFDLHESDDVLKNLNRVPISSSRANQIRSPQLGY